MEPILNTFSSAGELRGNVAGFTPKAFLVSPFVPVKYSIPTLPCTTSLFGDAWLVPNWKHLFWSWGVNFRPRHSFMILRCFILCLPLNPDRAPLFLVHRWPSIPQLPAVTCDIRGRLTPPCRITRKQMWGILRYPMLQNILFTFWWWDMEKKEDELYKQAGRLCR